MKAYIHYIKGHSESEKQAQGSLDSLKDSGFVVNLKEGITPKTLDNYKHWPELVNGRVTKFKKESEKVYRTKMSCFLNHVELWKEVVNTGEPMAFLEHDCINVSKWNNPFWDEVLVLNATSAFNQKVFSHVRNKPTFKFGIHDCPESPLIYNKDNLFKGGRMIPGTGAYAITVKGAKKALASLEKNGWEQSDYFINTNNLRIQYATPEYFAMRKNNLKTSHGI